MKKISILLSIVLLTLVMGCNFESEPEGVVKNIIEPFRNIANPIYYWETHDGKTAVFRIMDSTLDINTILFGLDGVRELKSSRNAVYILQTNNDNNLFVSRLEHDRAMTHEAYPSVNITPTSETPWAVSRNDVAMVFGADDEGMNHVFAITFRRTEADESFRANEVLEPTITFEETEWFSTSEQIGDIAISDEADRLAVTLPLNDGSGGYGLYFIDGPGQTPQRIGDDAVVEIGGFSSNNRFFLASFEQPRRVDIFLVNTETLEARPVTRVATNYIAGHPSWHPNSRYFIYTLDYTEEFIQQDTSLSGEQLYLYSIDSMNDRRLTSFTNTDLWVDFSPAGDFFMYASTPGMISRFGRGILTEEEEQAVEEQGLETWRLSYVEWNPDEFQTGNIRIMTPEETRFLIGWTAGGSEVIGFAWGPGGE